MKTDDVTDTLKAAQEWFERPAFDDIDTAIKTGETFLSNLQSLKNDNPKDVGPLLGKVNGKLGRITSMDRVAWFGLAGGNVAIGHRPSKKKLDELKLQGASHILTLLCGSEGALAVKKTTEVTGLGWVWFAMDNGNPPGPERDMEAKALFTDIKQLLADGGNIYIHCSAGIHRTGMIANALLRFLGHTQDAADTALLAMRQETSEGVGDHRKAWAERFAHSS